ncbi:MAG: family 43 glycosylhydrolase [Phycisphaerae bacterium]
MKSLLVLLITSMGAGLMAGCATTRHEAQGTEGSTGAVYSPDLGNGKYKNPIIFADYSDPDVIRVGSDFYLTASSFTCFPGLPILHSKDLVNWTIIGHAITKYPLKGFEMHVNGDGVWAPAIRYHNGEFYIYFADPDNGVFMTKTRDPGGTWAPLVQVHAGGKGWIDTCPFWDDDGQAYLIHAFAGSRSGGLKNILHICRMSADGTHTLDEGRLVLDGEKFKFSTIEGPKLYKREGWYYIFCPGGGVSTGYQVVARSRNIFGPYEARIVMKQGKTPVNGPHQGAWVTTSDGANAQDWFVHFQDDGGFGRITHLQPMAWHDGWPVIGRPLADDPTCGQPVMEWKKPEVGREYPVAVPQTSDEFDGAEMGPQWQWFGNYADDWAAVEGGHLKLRAVSVFSSPVTLFQRANLLTQKTPADRFTVTTRLDASHLGSGDSTGLLLTGLGTAALQVENRGGALRVVRTTAQPPKKPKSPKAAAPQPALTQPGTKAAESTVNPKFSIPPEPDVEEASRSLSGPVVYLRLQVHPSGPPGDSRKLPKAVAETSFSTDGEHFTKLGKAFAVAQNGWIGAKLGLFCNAPAESDSRGFADFDYFRFSR